MPPPPPPATTLISLLKATLLLPLLLPPPSPLLLSIAVGEHMLGHEMSMQLPCPPPRPRSALSSTESGGEPNSVPAASAPGARLEALIPFPQAATASARVRSNAVATPSCMRTTRLLPGAVWIGVTPPILPPPLPLPPPPPMTIISPEGEVEVEEAGNSEESVEDAFGAEDLT